MIVKQIEFMVIINQTSEEKKFPFKAITYIAPQKLITINRKKTEYLSSFNTASFSVINFFWRNTINTARGKITPKIIAEDIVIEESMNDESRIKAMYKKPNKVKIGGINISETIRAILLIACTSDHFVL